MKSLKTSAIAALTLCSSAAFANSVGIADFTFSFFNGPSAVTTGAYDARWGSFSGGLFTPFLGAVSTNDNLGYFDASGPEIAVTFAQIDNSNVAAGTQLSLSLTLAEYASIFSNAAPQVILTDPSWIAPTFVFLTEPQIVFSFTSNTTAQRGLFSFNGGNEILNTVIPEPSSFAALAGLAAVGMVVTRRRRSV